ncbi:hypothetical protein Btru_026187 [Bulinus truncatus]|nr:hypothetical protein Btru_026187 [Bulinus truncatus]
MASLINRLKTRVNREMECVANTYEVEDYNERPNIDQCCGYESIVERLDMTPPTNLESFHRSLTDVANLLNDVITLDLTSLNVSVVHEINITLCRLQRHFNHDGPQIQIAAPNCRRSILNRWYAYPNGYRKDYAGVQERLCRGTGKTKQGYGNDNAGVRERLCRGTGKTMQGYGKDYAGVRERLCRGTGMTMQGYRKDYAGVQERLCRGTGKTMQGYGKDYAGVRERLCREAKKTNEFLYSKTFI